MLSDITSKKLEGIRKCAKSDVECHQLLHAGKLPDWRFKNDKVESVVH